MFSHCVSAARRGGPEVLEWRREVVGRPGPGQARVRVLAAGVSFGDVLLRAGVIPGGPKPPFTPGFDVTGVIEQVGPPADIRPGELVTGLLRSGGYAEQVLVPADRLLPVPAGVDPVRVAAVALNYFVAYQMLHRVARVRAGQRVLVHGAAGGVGTAVLQLAALAGVEVWGTCSAGKRHVVRELGGHPIDHRAEDFLAVVGGLPGGSVDAVLDPVGGSNFRRSYRALRRGGVLIGYGQSDALVDGRARKLVGARGFLGGIVAPKLVPDGRSTVFYTAWSLEKKHPEAYREDLATLLRLLADGRIDPVLAQTIPMPDAAKAHELLERSAVVGKLVLTTDAPRAGRGR